MPFYAPTRASGSPLIERYGLGGLADELANRSDFAQLAGGAYGQAMLADLGFKRMGFGEDARILSTGKQAFEMLARFRRGFQKHYTQLRGESPDGSMWGRELDAARAFRLTVEELGIRYAPSKSPASALANGYLDCDLSAYLFIQLASEQGIRADLGIVAREGSTTADHAQVVVTRTDGTPMRIRSEFLVENRLSQTPTDPDEIRRSRMLDILGGEGSLLKVMSGQTSTFTELYAEVIQTGAQAQMKPWVVENMGFGNEREAYEQRVLQELVPKKENPYQSYEAVAHELLPDVQAIYARHSREHPQWEQNGVQKPDWESIGMIAIQMETGKPFTLTSGIMQDADYRAFLQDVYARILPPLGERVGRTYTHRFTSLDGLMSSQFDLSGNPQDRPSARMDGPRDKPSAGAVGTQKDTAPMGAAPEQAEAAQAGRRPQTPQAPQAAQVGEEEGEEMAAREFQRRLPDGRLSAYQRLNRPLDEMQAQAWIVQDTSGSMGAQEEESAQLVEWIQGRMDKGTVQLTSLEMGSDYQSRLEQLTRLIKTDRIAPGSQVIFVGDGDVNLQYVPAESARAELVEAARRKGVSIYFAYYENEGYGDAGRLERLAARRRAGGKTEQAEAAERERAGILANRRARMQAYRDLCQQTSGAFFEIPDQPDGEGGRRMQIGEPQRERIDETLLAAARTHLDDPRWQTRGRGELEVDETRGRIYLNPLMGDPTFSKMGLRLRTRDGRTLECELIRDDESGRLALAETRTLRFVDAFSLLGTDRSWLRVRARVGEEGSEQTVLEIRRRDSGRALDGESEQKLDQLAQRTMAITMLVDGSRSLGERVGPAREAFQLIAARLSQNPDVACRERAMEPDQANTDLDNYAASLTRQLDEWKRRPPAEGAERHILLVGDGGNQDLRTQLPALIQRCQEMGVKVHFVCIERSTTADVGDVVEQVRRLSGETGGSFIDLRGPTSDQLDEEEIQTQVGRRVVEALSGPARTGTGGAAKRTVGQR